MSDSAPQAKDAATGGLALACIVGGVTVLVCMVLFEILRRRIPTVFELRRVLRERGENRGYNGEQLGVSDPPSRALFFGWISSTLKQTPQVLEKTHGLDAAFFSRYLRSNLILHVALSIICCGCLLPIYYTAGNKDLPVGNALRTLGIQRFSMGNLPADDSWRFWCTFCIYVCTVVLTVTFTLLDYRAYEAARRRYRASKNPANYAILFQDIPPEVATEGQIFDYWNGLFPGEVEHVHQACDASKLVVKKNKWLNAVTQRECAEWNFVYNKKLAGARPTHKAGACGCCKGESASVDSIAHWSEQQQHYTEKINLYLSSKDPKHVRPLPAGIVVFKTKRTASVAAQVLFARNSSEWKASRAAEPDAVNYKALAIDGKTTDVRRLITAASITALTLLWIIPVTFVQGLANLTALARIEVNGAKPFGFLRVVAGWNPGLISLVEGLLPPVIQSVFLSLIPVFITLLVSISRVVSLARVDALVRNWYHFFLFFNAFIFVLLGGAILQSLPLLIQIVSNADYRAAADVFAKTVPAQGTFFMTFVIVNALSATPQSLVQLPRVVIRFLLRKFLSTTPRQLQARDMGGSLFLYFQHYAVSQLVTLISLSYAAVSPLVVPCCLCYYVTSYLVHTHNIAYNMVQPFGGGGAMFSGSVSATFLALGVQGQVMGGLFALNGKGAQSFLTGVISASSFLAYLYMERRFPRIAKHGSALETQIADEEKGGEIMSPELARKYVHPGLAPLPDPVPNMSGVERRQLLKMGAGKAEVAEKVALPPSSQASEDVENGAGAALARADIAAYEAVNGVSSEMNRTQDRPLAHSLASDDPGFYQDARDY
jgi:calcium permeable stress-gated cation channel